MTSQPSLLNKTFSTDRDGKISRGKPSREAESAQESRPTEVVAAPWYKQVNFQLSGALMLVGIVSLWYFLKPESVLPEVYIESAVTYNSVESSRTPLILDEPRVHLERTSQEDITVPADVYLAFSPDTYQVFSSRDIDKQVPIASIAKLMSALIVLDKYDLDEMITVGELDPELEWTLGLEEGDEITVNEALYAMMLSSYNDSAIVVAQNFSDGGYDGFITEMNNRAQLYGMYDSSFSNPNGYDHSDSYSTAADLRKLVLKVLANDQLMEILNTPAAYIRIFKPSGSVVAKTIYSTNYFLGRDATNKGLKTGSTTEAGPSFVGYFVDENDDKIVTILLNVDGNRFDETKELVNAARNNFK